MAHRRDRRRLLATAAAALCAPVLLLPSRGRANQLPRRLAFVHSHIGETLSTVYADGNTCVPEPLAAIDRLLRDHRTAQIRPIDPKLLDRLATWSALTGGSRPSYVICGYRYPATNAMLREHGHGLAKASLHLTGRAIDVRLSAVPLTTPRDAPLVMDPAPSSVDSRDHLRAASARSSVRSWP
jgi:uncharacterized protein YcbK (DUF882 family)